MHSLLIIAETEGRSIGDLMEPYWEDLEVEEYCEGDVSEMDRQQFLDYYNSHTPGYHFSAADFEDLYKAKGEEWNDNAWRKGEDGKWYKWSSYNHDSRWDWHEIGGRWAGWLQLKEGVERMQPLNFSLGWSSELKQRVAEEKPLRADMARLGDINNLDKLVAGAVMVNGEWIDIEDGIQFTEVKKYFEGLPDDTVIVCIDFHI